MPLTKEQKKQIENLFLTYWSNPKSVPDSIVPYMIELGQRLGIQSESQIKAKRQLEDYQPQTTQLIKNLLLGVSGVRPLQPTEPVPTPEIKAAVEQPLVNITSRLPKPGKNQIFYGAGYGLLSLMEGFTSPENITLLATMGAAPETVKHLGGAIFRTLMGIGALQQANLAKKKIKEGNYGMGASHIVEALGQGLLAATGSKTKEEKLQSRLTKELKKSGFEKPEEVATAIIDAAKKKASTEAGREKVVQPQPEPPKTSEAPKPKVEIKEPEITPEPEKPEVPTGKPKPKVSQEKLVMPEPPKSINDILDNRLRVAGFTDEQIGRMTEATKKDIVGKKLSPQEVSILRNGSYKVIPERKTVSSEKRIEKVSLKRTGQQSLVTAVQRHGGINPGKDWSAQELRQDGLGFIINKAKGKHPDDLAKTLQEEGFNVKDGDDLIEQLKFNQRATKTITATREVPTKTIKAGELETGDKVLVGGEWLDVTESKNGDIILKDGQRFKLDPKDEIEVEYEAPGKVGIKEPEKAKSQEAVQEKSTQPTVTEVVAGDLKDGEKIKLEDDKWYEVKHQDGNVLLKGETTKTFDVFDKINLKDRKMGEPSKETTTEVDQDWKTRPVPKWDSLIEGDTLIDQSGTKYEVTEIHRKGVPGEWEYVLKNKETNGLIKRPFIDIERYYKMFDEGAKSSVPKEITEELAKVMNRGSNESVDPDGIMAMSEIDFADWVKENKPLRNVIFKWLQTTKQSSMGIPHKNLSKLLWKLGYENAYMYAGRDAFADYLRDLRGKSKSERPATRIEKTEAGDQITPMELRPQATIPKGQIGLESEPIEGVHGVGMFKTEPPKAEQMDLLTGGENAKNTITPKAPSTTKRPGTGKGANEAVQEPTGRPAEQRQKYIETDAGKYPADDTGELIDVNKVEAPPITHQVSDGVKEKLYPEQVEDVAAIVTRYSEGKKGYILANDTGSGKTFVIAGAIKELQSKGAKKILLVTMNKGLISQFKKDIAHFKLGDIRYATYAELRRGNLGNESWDVVVFDESHNIQNLTSKQGLAAQDVIKNSNYTIFSSATPFERPQDLRYIQHLGIFEKHGGFEEWARKHGVIERTIRVGNGQQIRIMEFRGDVNDLLAVAADMRAEGIYSKRPAKLPEGYVSSDFVKVDPDKELLSKMEDALDRLDALAQTENGMKRGLIRAYATNLARRFFESQKIKAAKKLIRQELDNGKSVVVFTGYRSDRAVGDTFIELDALGPHRQKLGTKITNALYGVDAQLTSPVDELLNEFGDIVVEYTGRITDKQALENKNKFLSGKAKVIVVTADKGGTGLSLHDTIGNRPTTQIMLTMPWNAKGVEQVTGRTARVGMKSPVQQYWLFVDHAHERYIANIIAGKMNSMGALVRGEVNVADAKKLAEFNFNMLDEAEDLRSGSEVNPLREFEQSVITNPDQALGISTVTERRKLKKPGNEKVELSFQDKELERQWRENWGVKTSLRDKIVDWANKIKSGFRTFIHLPRKDPYFAKAVEALRQLRQAPRIASSETAETLSRIFEPFDVDMASLAMRHLQLRDFKTALESQGKEAPFFGADLEKINSELEHLDKWLEANPEARLVEKYIRHYLDALGKALVDAGILRKNQLTEDYFPRHIMQYAQENSYYGKYKGTGRRLKRPRPGFTKYRRGSELPINTNYVQVLFDYITEAKLDLSIMDTIRKIGRDYNIHKELQDKWGSGWRDHIPEGYTLWYPDPARIFYRVNTIPEKIARALLEEGEESVEITADDIGVAMAMGGRRTPFVVKEEIAKQLNDLKNDVLGTRYGTTLLSKAINKPTRLWKIWTLLSPFRAMQYNKNNFIGDLNGVLAGNYKVVRKIPQAFKELYGHYYQDRPMTQEMYDYYIRGGISSAFTTIEAVDPAKIENFQRFFNRYAKQPKSLKVIKNISASIAKVVPKATAFREDILRYAAYLEYLDEIKQGNLKNYGASVPELVDALKDPKDKAAKLARELLGDYEALSHWGQELRTSLIPFYSWMEINTKRWPRLMKNAMRIKGQGAVTGLIVALRNMSGFLVRAANMYAAAHIWNNYVAPKVFGVNIEPELSEYDRSRLHISLGKDKQGRIRIIRTPTALGDFLEWFGLSEMPILVDMWSRKVISTQDVLLELAKAPIRKGVNSITPFLKTPFELLTGENFFPDPFSPVPIMDKWNHLLRVAQLETLYKDYKKIPQSQNVKQKLRDSFVTISRYDADELNYYEILSLKRRYMEKKLGKIDKGYMSPKSQLYRYYKKAKMYRQDDIAKVIMDMIIAKGWQQGLEASIEHSEPLYGLTKEQRRDFVLNYLNGFQREKLKQAYNYYNKLFTQSKEVGIAW